MKQITSSTNPLIKDLMKLYNKGERSKQRKYLIEGYHLVEEAYYANVLEMVLITKETDYLKGIDNILVNNDIISKLSKTKNPQGIVGICRIKDTFQFIGSRFLLLDNISDPGNLGTIIRSALGFNIDGIITSPESVDIYNDKVIRATQGALFKIPIIEMDIIEAIQKLKSVGVVIIGTSLKNSISLKALVKPPKYAIVLGNESQGVRERILESTDVNVKIDINDALESLNVAVAGAIVMYYLS